jgi:hypothetical protein
MAGVAGAARLTQIARLLLSRPPVLRMASQEGRTPLHIAAQKGHAGAVDRLIAARADVESKTKVLHAAERGAHLVTCVRKPVPLQAEVRLHRHSLPPQLQHAGERAWVGGGERARSWV